MTVYIVCSAEEEGNLELAGRTLHRHLSAVQGGLGPWVYDENMTANVTAHLKLFVAVTVSPEL